MKSVERVKTEYCIHPPKVTPASVLTVPLYAVLAVLALVATLRLESGFRPHAGGTAANNGPVATANS